MSKKIIFVIPPKDWFYGIDYKHTYEMIHELKKTKKFKIYLWKDIDIFLKEKNKYKRYFKINKTLVFFLKKKKLIMFCLQCKLYSLLQPNL